MCKNELLFEENVDILPSFQISGKYQGRRHPQDFLSGFTRLPKISDKPDKHISVELKLSSLELEKNRTVRLNRGDF